MAGHELTTDFANDEIEVAGILLQLPRLILGREFFPDLFSCWGSKKRRSTTNNNNNQASQAAVVPPPPEPSSAPPEDREDRRRTEKDKDKDKATSPATPLSFSPSESEERRKPSKRKSQKTKEEWLEIIKVLKDRRELLKKEVENVSRYYDKLKAFNLELKARKEELITRGLKEETPHSKIGQDVNHAIELGGQPKESTASPEFHHTPFITDQAVQTMGVNENLRFLASHNIPSSLLSSGFGGNNNNKVSAIPLGIPDLNVSAEESDVMDCFQPYDLSMANKNLSRAMASEARRRRRQICKGKTSVAADRLRYPC